MIVIYTVCGRRRGKKMKEFDTCYEEWVALFVYSYMFKSTDTLTGQQEQFFD